MLVCLGVPSARSQSFGMAFTAVALDDVRFHPTPCAQGTGCTAGGADGGVQASLRAAGTVQRNAAASLEGVACVPQPDLPEPDLSQWKADFGSQLRAEYRTLLDSSSQGPFCQTQIATLYGTLRARVQAAHDVSRCAPVRQQRLAFAELKALWGLCRDVQGAGHALPALPFSMGMDDDDAVVQKRNELGRKQVRQAIRRGVS